MRALRPRTMLLVNAIAAALFLSGAPAQAAGPSGTAGQAAADQQGALTQAQKDALKSHIDACDKLPENQRGSCVDRARHDFARMDPTLSAAQKAALEREAARYQAAMNACNKRPLSERNTCKSEAGMDYRLAGVS